MAVSTIPPPADDEAEQFVIGELIRNAGAIEAVPELCSFHFADVTHAELFKILVARAHAGHPVDLATLVDDLAVVPLLEPVGGTQYLVQLAGAQPGGRDLPAAAARLRDLWQRRALLGLFAGMASTAEDGALRARGLIDRQAAADFARETAACVATWFQILGAIVGPPLPAAFDKPDNLVTLMPALREEIAEFAAFHDRQALADELAGDGGLAQARRSRAEQLRAIAEVRS